MGLRKRAMSSAHDRVGPVPEPRPAWVTDSLLEATITVWSTRYGRRLTPGEAVAILQSVGNLLDLLRED